MAAEPILFIAGSRLGDAVLASGLVRRLAETTPQARFTIVGSPLTAPLFACTPGLEALMAMEKQPAGLHWLRLWARLVGRRWRLVVDMRGSPLARFLVCDARAVARSGGPPEHKVVAAARLLGWQADPPAPSLFLDRASRERAAGLIAGPGPILALAPGAAWVGKAWPAARFAELARRLLGSSGALCGGRLMIVGGPGDEAAAAPLRHAFAPERRIDLVGRADLLTAYAALQGADLFVGADSGLTHLAAAAGAPTLALFGPSDERLYAPWGPGARAMRGPRPFEDFLRLDPRLDGSLPHMEDLSLARVVAEAEALLKAHRAEPAHA